jgi:hypothetical protein
MPSPEDLRAQAKDLYDQAHQVDDLEERLPYVLRALELEVDADAIEGHDEATLPLHMIAQQKCGQRESA